MEALPNIDAILEANLTPEQCSAARDDAREVLGLACAGSGKSRTLAFRIARLIALGADPRGIVAFTFTEKAAEAIKLRVAQALVAADLEPTLVGAMYVGTIHSYCQGVLGSMDARYRQFEVLDSNRLKLYLISRYPQLGLNALRPRARGGSYFDTIKRVSESWMMMNDELVQRDAVIAADPELGQALDAVAQSLTNDQYIDFSLMIRLVVEALRLGDAGAERAVAQIEHLMVDEYQDINPSQEALIRELHSRIETLFVVGDDDQAVYAWRGADVSNILEFAQRYPDCTEHTLATNFRSTESIVDAADGFAAAELGATRLAKNPTADSNASPRDYRKLWFADRDAEAEWVADRIAALLGKAYRENDGTLRGLTPGDFAILMRSTRTDEQDGTPRHSAFTNALRVRGIAYTLEAGGGVFDRSQVEVLRQSFELLRNGSPTRDEVQAHFQTNVLPAYPQASFRPVTETYAEWGRLIHAPFAGVRRRVFPQQLVYDLLSAFGITEAGFDAGVLQDLGVFSRMMQDVETVYLSVDSASRFGQICNFLNHAADAGYDTGTQEILRRPDTVTVGTVHKMKGLEFPAVFVVDVEAQRFPGRRHNYDGWLPAEIIQSSLDRGAYQSTREAEARLFYTAITRAERFLYVSGSEHLPGGVQARRESPFTQRLAHAEISGDPAGIPAGLADHPPARRIDETVVPTTYSDIRYYLRCPQDYRFRKMFGFSPPITEMFGFGQTVHASVGKLHEQFEAAAPAPDDAERVARDMFHLKHVAPSGDPVNRPGPYERGEDSSAEILRSYATDYAEDFSRRRQVEVRFEIPIEQAVISGSIDLLLHEDNEGNILDAQVIDFKAMRGGDDPEGNEELNWTELALQVQLYAKAAREVLGDNARTGSVHLLKDNQRVDVPVDDASVDAAVRNVEWSVDRVLAQDFPMRPHPTKCDACDFNAICPKTPQAFATDEEPPAIHIPGGAPAERARAFSEYEAA